MRRILLRSSKSPFDAVSPEMVMQQHIGGANIGNLVFSDAVHKTLYTPNAEVTPTGFGANPDDAEWINDAYDVVVLPFANAFRPAFAASLEAWSALIERLRIPVVVLGIGAQSSLDYDMAPLRPVEKQVRRFVRAVLERSPSIGVRGEFTQRYLNQLGFSEVDVIGCPSMFRFGASLGVDKSEGGLDATSRIAFSVTDNTAGDVAGILNSNAERYPRLHYVAQDIKDLELMYWGDTSQARGVHAAVPKHRTHLLFAQNRVRLFLEPASWIEGMGDYDFSCGTRIHGTITALLGGTPGVVLCHDSRTRELSEYFELPHQHITALSSDVDLAELYEQADFDPLRFGHKERFDRFTTFLAKHGLEHVYGPAGDSGAAFEERMREIDFAGPVEVRSDENHGFRIAWLKENVAQLKATQKKADRRIGELSAKVRALEDALHRLEGGRQPRSLYRRVRSGLARRLRRLRPGGR